MLLLQRFVLAAAALLMAASQASADPWTGPDPSRRPKLFGAADMDFAVSELCFPFLLNNAAIADITHRQGVITQNHPPAWADSAPTFWVGQPNASIALQVSANGTRSCTIRIDRGDSAHYRQELDTRLAQWPAPFIRAQSQIPAHDYASRDLFCGPAADPQDALLVSQGDGRTTASIMVTISRGGQRSPRCDTTNYDAAATRTPVDGFAQAAFLCHAATIGRAPVADVFRAGHATLPPAQRAGATPLGGNPQTGVANFFGADTPIHILAERPDIIPGLRLLLLIVSDDGAHCQVSAIGRGDFVARARQDLAAHESDWSEDGADALVRSNGDRVRIETAPNNADGLSVIHLYFTRGSR